MTGSSDILFANVLNNILSDNCNLLKHSICAAKLRIYGPITIAIRVRFEHSMLQHATRFFVRSHTSPIRAPYENRVEACRRVIQLIDS